MFLYTMDMGRKFEMLDFHMTPEAQSVTTVNQPYRLNMMRRLYEEMGKNPPKDALSLQRINVVCLIRGGLAKLQIRGAAVISSGYKTDHVVQAKTAASTIRLEIKASRFGRELSGSVMTQRPCAVTHRRSSSC